MTGSGSVCYGLFNDQMSAKKALNNLKNKYPKFWLSLAKTV
jgi:4-diphosphocytidyl-2C-methyl-D-erythritol kinase